MVVVLDFRFKPFLDRLKAATGASDMDIEAAWLEACRLRKTEIHTVRRLGELRRRSDWATSEYSGSRASHETSKALEAMSPKKRELAAAILGELRRSGHTPLVGF